MVGRVQPLQVLCLCVHTLSLSQQGGMKYAENINKNKCKYKELLSSWEIYFWIYKNCNVYWSKTKNWRRAVSPEETDQIKLSSKLLAILAILTHPALTMFKGRVGMSNEIQARKGTQKGNVLAILNVRKKEYISNKE